MVEIQLLCLSILLLFFSAYLSIFFGKIFNVTISQDNGFDHNLEILRGIAAFSVFIAHLSMYYGYITPKYFLSTVSGAAGVSVFFMLTAYLFWTQVLEKRIDFNAFFQKRVKRLAPIALLIITVVTILDYVVSYRGIPTVLNFINFIKNLAFGFGGINDVFSPNMYLRINTIWTLRWEWSFYLFLPILALWPTKRSLFIFFLIFVIIFTDIDKLFSGQSDVVFYLSFLLGALSVYLKKRFVKNNRLALTSLALFIITIVFLFKYNSEHVDYKSLWITLGCFFVFLFFLFVNFTKQNKIFIGLQLLGKVSYSFYLWHLAIGYYTIGFLRKIISSDDGVSILSNIKTYFPIGSFLVIVTLFISFLTYKYIEEFFLRKNKSPLKSPLVASK